MLKIMHRINTITELKTIDTKYGVEIDCRAYQDEIVLNHEPFEKGDFLREYLQYYQHAFIILNIKEAGIEAKVIELMHTHNIENYFLLDVEFPYIYRSTREGNRKIAIRYSEDEPLEQALLYKQKLDYLFIDTNTQLPLNEQIHEKIKGFQTCLVSPDRWGRPEDIKKYREKMQAGNYGVDMVMVSRKYVHLWEE